MNKKHLIPIGVIAGTLILTGVYGVSTASAATDTNQFSPMVNRMVEKFNLNTDEVRTLVEEDRTVRQAERKAGFETKLSEAVTASKITEAQRAAIVAKHDELAVKREAIRDESMEDREARRDKMQALRTEMTDFLKAQGIDESVMPEPQGPRGGMGGGQMGEGRGFGGGRMHNSNN